MFAAWWRRIRNRPTVLPRGKCLRGGQLPYRPRLEPLEGRTLPALFGGGFFTFPTAPDAVSGPQPTGITLPGAAKPTRVTVAQNAPETVVDLGAVFSAVSGIQHGDGLQLSVLGNTNSGLVSTDLSEAALTLTYTRGGVGTATITVGATDADGVSVQQTLVVTVRPPWPAGTVVVAPLPAVPQKAMLPDTSQEAGTTAFGLGAPPVGDGQAAR